MLKKLMKYDLKKILKFLVWFYAISVGLAIIARILKIWDNVQIVRIVQSVFASLTYSAVATVLINTFIHILLRFSTSFYKDQSYLTHTLPVKKETLILSKYLSSLIVIFASVAVSALSLLIVFYSQEFTETLKVLLNNTIAGLNISGGVFVLLMVFVVFSQICAMISMAFTTIVKGYSYNTKRGVKGFLWFALYYVASMMATLVLIVIVSAVTGTLGSLFAETMPGNVLVTVMIVCLVVYACYSVLFYFVCQKEFKKGVNVD